MDDQKKNKSWTAWALGAVALLVLGLSSITFALTAQGAGEEPPAFCVTASGYGGEFHSKKVGSCLPPKGAPSIAPAAGLSQCSLYPGSLGLTPVVEMIWETDAVNPKMEYAAVTGDGVTPIPAALKVETTSTGKSFKTTLSGPGLLPGPATSTRSATYGIRIVESGHASEWLLGKASMGLSGFPSSCSWGLL